MNLLIRQHGSTTDQRWKPALQERFRSASTRVGAQHERTPFRVQTGETAPALVQEGIERTDVQSIEEAGTPFAPTPEGGTARAEDFEAIEGAVTSLSEIVAPEELESGMDTMLIPALYNLVRTHGEGAVLELAASIESNEIDPDLGSWILRWLGRLVDHRTHRVRRWLLERGLQSPVPAIREGAVLGLATLGDRRAFPALKAALERERYSRLHRHMEKALRPLNP